MGKPADKQDDRAYVNTDTELYRENTADLAGSYYENSVSVTKDGVLQLNVGGHVVGKRIAEWHALANATDSSSDTPRWGNPPVSDCHKAPMRVVGGDEGTNHFECTECGQPCNMYNDALGSRLLADFTKLESEPQTPAKANSTNSKSNELWLKVIETDRFKGHLEQFERIEALLQQTALEARINEHAKIRLSSKAPFTPEGLKWSDKRISALQSQIKSLEAEKEKL